MTTTLSSPQPGCVAVTDKLVAGTEHEIRQKVTDLLAEGARAVTLDLAQCPYVDAKGIGALVSCANACKRAGGRLVLINVNEDLNTLFGLVHLQRVLSWSLPARAH